MASAGPAKSDANMQKICGGDIRSFISKDRFALVKQPISIADLKNYSIWPTSER